MRMRILLIGHGYVGSYLADRFAVSDVDLTICSRSADGAGPAAHVERIVGPYQELSAERLASFDRILWFAGHSSVKAAVEDPEGAILNNCFDLLELARRKPPDTPLIYASTASLYSEARPGEGIVPEARAETQALISSLNAYDSSKAAFDSLVGPLAERTCGLRLGTVCGGSRNLRPELVFNSMNLSAIDQGTVRVANQDAWRSLLFLDDLFQVVDRLIRSDVAAPRFMNVSSVDVQLGDLAKQIADFHGADIDVLPDSATYSFRMATDLMAEVAGPFEAVAIGEHCARFTDAVKAGR